MTKIPDGIIKQQDAVGKSYNDFISSLNSPLQLPGADIGIHDLNLAIGGHLRKKVTTIAGRSGMGKTASIIPMFDAGNRVVSGKKPFFMFLTWESPAEEVVGRYICYKTGLSHRRVFQFTKLLSKRDLNNIDRFYKDAYNLPVIYQEISTDFKKVRELSEYFKFACERKQKENKDVEIIPVIILDYIGMAKFTGSKDARTYKIGEFMNNLKSLAKEDDCHILPLAQINRSSDSKDMPGREDLSDSQGIEQASDNLIIVHRPEYQGQTQIKIGNETEDARGKVIFRIMKGRSVGVGDVLMNCDISCNRFWSHSHSPDYKFYELYDDENFWRTTL